MMFVGGLQWKEEKRPEFLVPCGLLGETGRLSVFHRVGSKCLPSFQVSDQKLQIVFEKQSDLNGDFYIIRLGLREKRSRLCSVLVFLLHTLTQTVFLV